MAILELGNLTFVEVRGVPDLLLSALPSSAAPFAAGFAGTLPVSPATVTALIADRVPRRVAQALGATPPQPGVAAQRDPRRHRVPLEFWA